MSNVVNGVGGEFTATWTGADSPAPTLLVQAANNITAGTSMYINAPDSPGKFQTVMLANSEVTGPELWNAILDNNWPNSFTGAFYTLVGYNTTQCAVALFTDNLGNGPSFQTVINLPRIPTPGVDKVEIYYEINGSNYDFYMGILGDNDYQLVASLPVANAPNGLKPSIIAIWTAGPPIPNFSIGANFGTGGSSAIKPSDAVFGSSYLATGPGIYDGYNIETGWIVQFIGDTSIFVYKPPQSIQDSIDTSIAAALVGIPTGDANLTPVVATYDTTTLYNFTVNSGGTDPNIFAGAKYKRLNITGVGDDLNGGNTSINVTVDLGSSNNPIPQDFLLELLWDGSSISMDAHSTSINSGGVNTTVKNLFLTFSYGNGKVIGSYVFPIVNITGQLWRVSGLSCKLLASKLREDGNYKWFSDKLVKQTEYMVLLDNTTHTYEDIQVPYYGIDNVTLIPTRNIEAIYLGNPSQIDTLRPRNFIIDNSGEYICSLYLNNIFGTDSMPLAMGVTKLQYTHGLPWRVVPSAVNYFKPTPMGFAGNYSLNIAALQPHYKDIRVRLDGIPEAASIILDIEDRATVDISITGGTIGNTYSFNMGNSLGNKIKYNSPTYLKIVSNGPDNAYFTLADYGRNVEQMTIYLQDSDHGNPIILPYINSQRIKFDTSSLTGPINIQLSRIDRMVQAYDNVLIFAAGSNHNISLFGLVPSGGIVLQEGHALECTVNKVQELGPWTAPSFG